MRERPAELLGGWKCRASGIEAVRRAIELSATKYCTVTGNLASGVAEIHHAYLVHGADGEEHYADVVVTGPDESPNALGQRVTARRV